MIDTENEIVDKDCDRTLDEDSLISLRVSTTTFLNGVLDHERYDWICNKYFGRSLTDSEISDIKSLCQDCKITVNGQSKYCGYSMDKPVCNYFLSLADRNTPLNSADADDADLIAETPEFLFSDDDQVLEPTVYLTGNTPVTATEMMMSQLHEVDQVVQLARELLDFAAYLGSEDYDENTGMKIMKRIGGGYNLTASEVYRYTDIAISVRLFVDTHDDGYYSTL